MHTKTLDTFQEVETIKLGFAPVGRPIMSVHMYLLDVLLVDTCQSNMARHALAMLKGKNVDQIILTHHHEDHSGNAALIADRHKAYIMAHPIAVEKMKTRTRICPYQHLLWGHAPSCTVIPYGATIKTERFELTPIHTPGHSRDHTVYLEKNRGWLFSGDLFLGERIKYFRKDEDMGAQIQSLKSIIRFDFDTLFCSHHPAWKNGREKIIKKLRFLEEIYGSVKLLHKKGLTPLEITKAIQLSSDRGERWFTLGNVSFKNMVVSALKNVLPGEEQDLIIN